MNTAFTLSIMIIFVFSVSVESVPRSKHYLVKVGDDDDNIRMDLDAKIELDRLVKNAYAPRDKIGIQEDYSNRD